MDYASNTRFYTVQQISKQLRKAVCGLDAKALDGMPEKYEGTDLEKEVAYVETLVEYVSKLPVSMFAAVSEKLNLLREKLDDVRDHYDVSKDGDARTGHKTQDSSFFGYKTHIAVNQERIITAATVTSGEKDDGSQMQTLIDKSIENGMYVCPAGHMDIKKGILKDEKIETCYFDVKRCIVCKQREGCFKFNQMSKTYCVCHRTEEQERQMNFQETDEFREKYRTRYKKEA